MNVLFYYIDLKHNQGCVQICIRGFFEKASFLFQIVPDKVKKSLNIDNKIRK